VSGLRDKAELRMKSDERRGANVIGQMWDVIEQQK
jgi:hypothetical protein